MLFIGAGAEPKAHTNTFGTCQCTLYCNYCDEPHRSRFNLDSYSRNRTYDSVHLDRVTDDLYSVDTVKRNYEKYMDYYCDALYDKSKHFCINTLCTLSQHATQTAVLTLYAAQGLGRWCPTLAFHYQRT